MGKISPITKDILKTLLGLGVVALGVTTPFFVVALLSLCFLDKYPKAKFRVSFSNLKKRGLVKITKRKGKTLILLTKKGTVKAKKIAIEDIFIKIPFHWDRKWRIVIFDVPESLRQVRDLLRLKLKQLGFYRLQGSVWIFPHNCLKEINLLREFFNLSPRRLILFTTNSIVNEDYFKKIFNLK
ncbi:MAG: hypothetical protein AB1465_02970 [Patescibacteria group bacterium]